MEPCAPFVLLLLVSVTFSAEGDTLLTNHLEELLSLSELPLEKLLHVKRTFVDPPPEDIPDDSTMYHAAGDEGSSSSDSLDASSPEALALMGVGGGKTKRINPLTYKGVPGRVKTPLRRGGSIHALLQGKGKGKKGSISTIFQASVTALSFLAFGGYLLCLIVQAIRAKNASMAMPTNAPAMASNTSKFVFLGRRPTFGKRRKRDSTKKGNSTEYFQNKTLEETQRKTKFNRRRLTDERVPNALAIQYGKKHGIQSNVTDATNIAGMEATMSIVVTENHGSKGRQEPPKGPERADEENVETSENDEYADMDNTEDTQQERVYHEDEVEITHWPLANVEDMYRALVIITTATNLWSLVFVTCCALQLSCFAVKTKSRGDTEDFLWAKERQMRSLLDTGAVVAKFREGLNMAGKFLGLNTAQGVAHLVSSSLLTTRPQWLREGTDAGLQHGLFSGFFRLLGLDSTKLGAIALNAIIFIAQLISNSLVQQQPLKDSARSAYNTEPEGSPVSWILDNPTVQLRDLLSTAQDHLLTDRVITTIQERYTDDETGCVQLLVCKSSPFVWGMQKAVRALLNNEEDTKGWSRLTPIQRMYSDMPSVQEVTEHGDQCEDRFPACRILPPDLGESWRN